MVKYLILSFQKLALKFSVKGIQKLHLLIILISSLYPAAVLKAQVATYYIFSQSSGTYTPGVPAALPASPASVFATGWDDVTTTYALPFDFTYNGVLYTTAGTIGVDADGWIAFSTGAITMTGQTAGGSWISGANTGAYLNGTANNNGFAGFNSDLKEQTFSTFSATRTSGSNVLTVVTSVANIQVGTRLSGSGIPDGTVVVSNTANTITMSANATSSGGSTTVTPRSSIYAFTRGVAPNRQFVIQWTQIQRYNTPVSDNFNFQLIINEGGGIANTQTVQVVYGSCSSSSATAIETQVGLRGAAATDFNARKSSTGWAVTTAATTNMDSVRFTSAIVPASGLTFTWSPCTVAPGAPGAISGPVSVCPNTTQTYSVPAVTGATSYTWSYSGTGVSFAPSTTTLSNTFVFSSGATTGDITVTPVNLCGSGVTSSPLTVTVTAITPATISYPAATYCISTVGSISVTQTGPGSGTYSTTPATGLTIVAATGAITPGSSTAGTYTVTYTYSSSGCSVTATTTVIIAPLPVITATATPASVCSGTNSQLLASVASASNYTVSNITYSSLSPSGSPTILWNTANDEVVSAAIPLPFSFNFYGQAITQFYVYDNGFIQLETSTGNSTIAQTVPDVTTPNKLISLVWDDLEIDPSINPGANVRYFLNGVTPNRVMVIDYNKLDFWWPAAGKVNGQIRLYENDSHIEVAVGKVDDAGDLSSKTLGIENSTGTLGLTPPGRNNTVWNVTNEAWAFYPPTAATYNYSWSPGTFLSSTTINNPLVTAVTATTTYTVTATNATTGCASTASATVTLLNVGAAGAISGASPLCPNVTQTFSLTAVTNATYYNWSYSGTGATYTASTASPSNSITFSSGATSGTLTVTPGNSCGDGTAATYSITITAITPASISYPAATYCTSTVGSISVTQTGPGSGTYSTTPATGLTIVPATGAITPSSSTAGTYTVTYTYSSSGCTATATTSVIIAGNPTVTATATPTSVCSGSNSQLLATVANPTGNYTVSSIAYSSLVPGGATTTIWNSYIDDGNSVAIALPFTFTYYGAAITQFYANTNGHIQLGTGVTPANTEQLIPDVTTPNTVIALAWDDLVVDPATNTGSNVRYFTNGVTPNRIFVVEYTNLRFIAGTGAQNVTGQIRLYENDNHIEVAVGTVNDNSTSRTKTLGIENSTGTLGVSPAGRNLAVWNVSNEAWAFYPAVVAGYTYSWSPATFLSSSTINNPVATAVTATTTYTITATNSTTGCTSTANATVTLLNVGAAGAISGTSPVCPNTIQTYTLTAVTNATFYNWSYSGTGATFSASTASPSNSITFSAGATGGTLTVTPGNTCGTGTGVTKSIAITAIVSASISYPASSYCISTAGNISVTQTGPAGGTYSTSPATGLTYVAGTGTITPSSSTAGTYTVTYTYTSNGCSATATTSVIIVANPAATASASPSPVCTGGNTQLTAGPTGGYTYSWSPATFLSSTAIYNPMANGVSASTTYSVAVTNTVTGCVGSSSVTVNIQAPLNGTYTVGAGGNYTTLTAAVNAYNTTCIGGPVIFSLISATYSASETFPITINQNAYANATNTLTIKPAAANTATISGSVASAALIKIMGNYITIDGSNNGTASRNLTITNTSATSSRVIWVGSSGTTPVINSTLKNCIVINGSTSTSAIVVSDGGAIGTAGYFNNIAIDNNSVQKALYGIYSIGVNVAGNGSGLSITSNLLNTSGANAIYDIGIYLQDIDGAVLQGNLIGNFTGSNANDDKGIWLATGVRNTSVLNNTISGLNYSGGSGYGAHGIYISTGNANAGIRVAHNMISNLTGDGYDYTGASGLDNPTGILLTTTQSGIELFYNTIHLGGVVGFTNTLNSALAVSVGIRLNTGSVADIRNNIIVNNLGRSGASGYGAIGILASTNNTQFTGINYNDIYINPTSGGKYFGQINTTGQTTLANWRTASGGEAQSINVLPVFTSTTDLHLVAASNPTLSNLGTPISGITTDFDGQTRNGTNPDMGADEWVKPNNGSWVGKTSIAWLTPSNWEANAVPDGTTDISITGGYTFMPTLITTQAIRNLTMSAPGTPPLLTITGTGTLQINGTITRSGGSIEGSAGTVEMNGTAAQTIPALLFTNNNLKNLVIGNTNNVTGVTLGGALDIYRSLTFSAPGLRLTTGDFLTFKSTATETAWLGNVTGKTITGTATVERYIPTSTGGFPNHGKSWQLLAAPVKGTQTVKQAWQDTATVANQNRYSGYGTQITSELGGNTAGATALGFDVYTAPGPTMKTYDPATNKYIGIANTNTLPIQNKKGYMVFVRGDRSVIAFNQNAVPTVLRAKGNLYTTGADLPPTTTLLAGKFESVGNPYPSAIDFLGITKPAAPAVDDVFYVWDPLIYGTYGYGAYQTISSTNGYKPNPGGTANYSSAIAYTKIQSGQAFLMHATGAGGTVSFTETAKLSGSQVLFRVPQNASNTLADRQFLRTGLYAVTNGQSRLADGNVVAFDNDFVNEYTADDALKIDNSGENFGVLSNGKVLAIEARKPVSANDTVFYDLNRLRKQAYQFRFGPENLASCRHQAFLIDRFLNSSTPVSLADSTFIDFEITNDAGSFATDRFMVVFKQAIALPVTITRITAIRNNDKQIAINWRVENEIGIERYELERAADGRSFAKMSTSLPAGNNGSTGYYDHIDENPYSTDNFYRVKAISQSGQVQYSAIVKVGPEKVRSFISVYPNPVVNKILSVSFNNMPSGVYQVRLVNKLGQLVYSNAVTVNGSIDIKSLSLDKDMSAGSYQLSITAEDGSKTIQQILVK